jgi:hypothetical protein
LRSKRGNNVSPLRDYYISPDTQRKSSVSPMHPLEENLKMSRVFKTLEKMQKPDEGIFENIGNLLLHDPSM